MKLLFNIVKLAFGLLSLVNVNGFVNLNKFEPFQKRVSIMYHNPLPPTEPVKPLITFKNKIRGLSKLTRPNNILPTLLLNFSGGWIMNPSFNNLLHSTPFIVSAVNTILVLMSSMVINDIYDYNIDKINNPSRPIASGQIEIYEAITFFLLLIGTAELMSMHFLPENLQIIIHFAIINVTLYTPIFKRIPFIKNISCAGLIAFAIFFSGLSSSTGSMYQHDNFGLLSIALSLIFYGSLSNEILLDIRDYEGDKKHNIITVPVLFGKYIAWLCAKIIANFSIMSNTLSLYYLTDFNNGIILALICAPITYNLYNLRDDSYTKENIVKIVNDTQMPMIFTLLYFCLLAYQGA